MSARRVSNNVHASKYRFSFKELSGMKFQPRYTPAIERRKQFVLDTESAVAHTANTIMRLHLILINLLGYVCYLSSATALTYKLHAHEKACFFAYAQEKDLKLAFYFAVS